MGSWYWWTILGMFLATYIPRMIPLTFLNDIKLPPIIIGILRNIPYAILGALIFPAVLYVQEGNILFGVIGAAVAFAIAYTGVNVILVVIGAIAVLSLYSLFFIS